MADATKIEWADATFNPWWGCERVSPGCAHCYADTLARRYGFGQTWGAGHGFRFFGDKHWAEPLKWARTLPAKLGRRPRVFCASMADVFEERPELDEHRTRLFDLIAETPELDWLILTKRPEFARDTFESWRRHPDASGEHPLELLPNVWLGVSIENARHTWRADVLREIPAAVRFISAEPLLGSLFERANDRRTESPSADEIRYVRSPLDLTCIDWIIVGGESGPRARAFYLEHANEIVLDCMCRHMPKCDGHPAVFVKQLGAQPRYFDDLTIGVYKERRLELRDAKGGDWDEWPSHLRIREFPRSAA